MQRWVLYVVMISLATVTGLTLVELSLVWMQYGEGVVQPHPIYGWSNIPHKTLTWRRAGGIHAQVRMNAGGFRDVSHTLEKPEGVYRIIVLGDSMVAAEQVELEQTFSSLLQQELNQKRTGTRFEVINLGVDGFGTDQELLLLQHEGVRYQPDLVLLCFFPGNDVSDNYFYELEGPVRPKPYFVLDDAGHLELKPIVQVPVPYSLKDRMLGRFRWYRLVRDVAYKNRTLRQGLVRARIMNITQTQQVSARLHTEGQVFAHDATPKWQQGWRLTLALIKAVWEESGQAGADFVLVHLPAPQELALAGDLEGLYSSRESLHIEVDKPFELLQAFTHEHGIPFLSLSQILRNRGDASKPFRGIHLEYDGHLTPLGHRLTAEVLATNIIARLQGEPVAAHR